jgi:hypothetical protein
MLIAEEKWPQEHSTCSRGTDGDTAAAVRKTAEETLTAVIEVTVDVENSTGCAGITY